MTPDGPFGDSLSEFRRGDYDLADLLGEDDPELFDRPLLERDERRLADEDAARGFTAAPLPPPPRLPVRERDHTLPEALEQAAVAADEDRFKTLVEAVLHEPDELAVGLLVPYIGTGGGIGRVAAHGLLMLGAGALDALLEALATGSPIVREHAAWALGSLRDPRVTDALLDALDHPEASPGLIESCLDSLAEIGDRRAVQPLLLKLREPTLQDYRAHLCRALGHIGDPVAVSRILPLLNNPKAMLRLRAAEALVRLLDRRGWPVLFALLRGDDARGESTVAALRGLGQLSSALASFLGDEEYGVRREAAEVLGTFGDTRAVPPLIESLGDINPWVRGAAAYALGRLGDRRGFKFLIIALKDEAAWVRQSAVRALGLLRDARARRPLEEMLFDQDPEICTAAQEALNVISER